MNIAPDTQLYFDDFEIGQVYPGQVRRLGEEEFALFARVTGDSHPIHYDVEYARSSRFGGRVAHGLLLVSITALGAIPLSARLEESMVALVEQDARFEKPVLIGETVSTEFRVEELRPSRSGLQGLVRFAVAMTNGRGEQVLTAHHTYLLKTRPA